jgi:predicted ATPase with chaperone activity
MKIISPPQQISIFLIPASLAGDHFPSPANFMLVAAMNPSPCGYYNHPQQECSCSPGVVQKYLNRISGPRMDRENWGS